MAYRFWKYLFALSALSACGWIHMLTSNVSSSSSYIAIAPIFVRCVLFTWSKNAWPFALRLRVFRQCAPLWYTSFYIMPRCLLTTFSYWPVVSASL